MAGVSPGESPASCQGVILSLYTASDYSLKAEENLLEGEVYNMILDNAHVSQTIFSMSEYNRKVWECVCVEFCHGYGPKSEIKAIKDFCNQMFWARESYEDVAEALNDFDADDLMALCYPKGPSYVGPPIGEQLSAIVRLREIGLDWRRSLHTPNTEVWVNGVISGLIRDAADVDTLRHLDEFCQEINKDLKTFLYSELPVHGLSYTEALEILKSMVKANTGRRRC